MSGKPSKRVTFSPDIRDQPKLPLKPDTKRRAAGKRKTVAGIYNFRLPRRAGFSPLRFIRRLGSNVARTIRVFSVRRVSPKTVPSSRSGSLVSQQDSHRTEAIEDCIEFINSSCSLQRSNSAPSNLFM
ncbi:josephin-like protein [Tasmannia lanceolata]|uniref:josephin-like protein n=1 Tax=Tasmannia lanceolata TaxID=3420 RepID=UPI004062D125